MGRVGVEREPAASFERAQGQGTCPPPPYDGYDPQGHAKTARAFGESVTIPPPLGGALCLLAGACPLSTGVRRRETARRGVELPTREECDLGCVLAVHVSLSLTAPASLSGLEGGQEAGKERGPQRFPSEMVARAGEDAIARVGPAVLRTIDGPEKSKILQYYATGRFCH